MWWADVRCVYLPARMVGWFCRGSRAASRVNICCVMPFVTPSFKKRHIHTHQCPCTRRHSYQSIISKQCRSLWRSFFCFCHFLLVNSSELLHDITKIQEGERFTNLERARYIIKREGQQGFCFHRLHAHYEPEIAALLLEMKQSETKWQQHWHVCTGT